MLRLALDKAARSWDPDLMYSAISAACSGDPCERGSDIQSCARLIKEKLYDLQVVGQGWPGGGTWWDQSSLWAVHVAVSSTFVGSEAAAVELQQPVAAPLLCCLQRLRESVVSSLTMCPIVCLFVEVTLFNKHLYNIVYRFVDFYVFVSFKLVESVQ